ncbi:MAG: 2-C-methyl-D-erythritol 2,4-cyclodiphosphate synthase [Calditrichaceae bacterium]
MRIGNGYAQIKYDAAQNIVIGGIDIISGDTTQVVWMRDAVAMAVSDSLLGAAALGDLNTIQGREKGSFHLLREVEKKIHYAGWKISNIDLTIIIEKDRLIGLKKNIAQNLAENLFINVEQVSIKVVDQEKSEPAYGVCYCSALLESRE